MSNPQQLVQKLWNYCNILRDDGLSYGDYVEQLTYLLFARIADKQIHNEAIGNLFKKKGDYHGRRICTHYIG